MQAVTSPYQTSYRRGIGRHSRRNLPFESGVGGLLLHSFTLFMAGFMAGFMGGRSALPIPRRGPVHIPLDQTSLERIYVLTRCSIDPVIGNLVDNDRHTRDLEPLQ